MLLCSAVSWAVSGSRGGSHVAVLLESPSIEQLHSPLTPCAQAKLEKPKRLREAAGRDWGEIEHGSLRWVMLAAAGWGIDGADQSTEAMLSILLGLPDNLQRCEPCYITAQRPHAHSYPICPPALQL